jgi:hypothetical protein
MVNKIKDYIVYGITKKGKKGEILGSVRGIKEKAIYCRLRKSGSLLDTPRGSKYPKFVVVKKIVRR